MSYSPTPSRYEDDGVMLRSKSMQLNGGSYRHTTTTPITNYPEHLNPFYKDDQHKRLRFLKVIPKKLHLKSFASTSSSSSSALRPKTERRNSFSVDGIKEIWKLRPFRNANKKPMSTHVVKTSESPPRIRAADARQRDEATFQEVPFQRSHRVRASMSEISTSGNGFGYRGNGVDTFARNTRYRSTMGGVPGQGSSTNSPLHSMRPGTSQLSVRSTNPFEEDMMDDDMISVSGYSVASMPNRPYRKKRRAPLPPTAASGASASANNKTDDDKASTNPRVKQTDTTEVDEIIAEKAALEIQNLSSEIDAMLRRTDSTESIKKPVNAEDTVHEDRAEKPLPSTEPNRESIPPSIESEERRVENSSSSVENNKAETKTGEKPSTDSQREESPNEELKTTVAIKTETEITEIVVESVSVTTDPLPVVPKKELLSTGDTLKIVESDDDGEVGGATKESTEKGSITNDPYKNVVVEMEKYDVRFVPLKDSAEDSTPAVGQERRNSGSSKTVKDIIDSINKSQSLLKINVEEQKRRASNGSINTRIRELERKESECNEMLNEIDLGGKFGGLYGQAAVVEEEEEEEIPSVIRELEKTEEEMRDMFKKCSPTRTNSNTTTTTTTLDWNPLPKPKRSHSSSPSSTPTENLI